MYGLGPWVRARLPEPAQGIKAQNLGAQGVGALTLESVAMAGEAKVLNGVSQIEVHELEMGF